MNLEQRLDQAEEIIKRPNFRENKGLGNEVGYYIFDYPAEQELLVRERIRQIVNKNKKSHDLFTIEVFDLYEIIIDTLIEKGFFDKCVEFEKEKGMDRIVKAIANTMKITSPDSLIINHIKNNISENSVVFIIGVGKCFPILRSHNVLNNLHQVIDNVPVVMFYPGIYSGQELILFSEIKDDNYYRAFKLVD
jgi:hypothetical protein